MFFPFTAIVGQEEMKLALLLNVIDPTIGGLLIRGEKGTAKSTAVRSLAALLPEIEVVMGCPFGCDPDGFLCTRCQERKQKEGTLPREKRKMGVVELPLGVTEDRLVGSLDIQLALQTGMKSFEPGILAAANRNFLYVDEVNLLEDHIVDLLLDAAAMGVNTVEREGISFSHPARFILVGTMNPEEGDLRPQLMDRFGLCVQVNSLREREKRLEILRRKIAFDRDPQGFYEVWKPKEQELLGKIKQARERLDVLRVGEEALRQVVEITSSLHLDGHRADIVMMKAACALAAFKGKERPDREEIREVAKLALRHRLKRYPFEEREEMEREIEFALEEGKR